MMKRFENSRQIPKDKDRYLPNMKYCDYLYAYLQVISKWSGKKGDPRYILKKDCSFTSIAQALNINRATASKKFKAMLEGQPDSLGLIRKEKDRYILLPIEADLAMLVEHGTLQVLTSTVKQHVISIYVYLLNRYFGVFETKFRYTIDELKKVVGLSTKTRSNNYIINSALFVLQRLGLLERIEHPMKDNQPPIYEIVKMSNEISNLPKQIVQEVCPQYATVLKESA